MSAPESGVPERGALKPLVQSASHFGVCVSDLERSVAFYRNALEFVEVARLRFDDAGTRQLLALPPNGTLEAVYLDRDGWRLELLHYPATGTEPGGAPRPMDRTGLTHLSFVVNALADVAANIEAHGGRILEDTRLEGVVFALDPDGTRLELMTQPFDPAAYAQA